MTAASPPIDLAGLGDEAFVSLTTYRRNGQPVSTPVWIGRDGDALVVTTPAESGKVKRLRNDPRVELRPCSRRGQVADGAPRAAGRVQIVGGAAAERATATIRRKYGLEYRVVMLVERLAARRRKPRVILRITRG